MEQWQLEARVEIVDLVARYNVFGDAGRIDAMLQLFAEDARVEVVPGRGYRGRGEIRALFEGAAEAGGAAPATRFIQHHLSTHWIDVTSPDRALGQSYFQVLTERGLDHWGRYQDVYSRAAGRWCFASREVRIDGQVPGGWGDATARRLHGR